MSVLSNPPMVLVVILTHPGVLGTDLKHPEVFKHPEVLIRPRHMSRLLLETTPVPARYF
jgi:hypothetical protein